MANVRTRMQLAWEAARQDWLRAADGMPGSRPDPAIAAVRLLARSRERSPLARVVML
jgi:hypothetical protein